MSDSIDALVNLSARLGADPLLVQGGGGNTSIKRDGQLWVKASGAWLMHARERDIFARLPLEETRALVRRDGGETELARRHAQGGLRPSIETSLHALLPHAVVLHVHSVNTIAHAVRANAQALLSRKLEGLRWALVPYRRPGWPLTEAMMDVLASFDTPPDVLVLANHGLVVGAESCAEAERLLHDVEQRLALPARPAQVPAPDAIDAIAEHGWRAPTSSEVHAIATDAVTLTIARAGVLYPDHVVFLGAQAQELRPGERVGEALARARDIAPRYLIAPNLGVLVAPDISAGAEAMLECLSLVGRRLDASDAICYLHDDQIMALVHWEAEAYRRARAVGA